MSKSQLVITDITKQGLTQAEAARTYGLSEATVSRLITPPVDKSGTITLRVASQLRHIGIGRTHAGTHVIMLIQDLNVRVINAITGQLLRELTINTTKDHQPLK